MGEFIAYQVALLFLHLLAAISNTAELAVLLIAIFSLLGVLIWSRS